MEYVETAGAHPIIEPTWLSDADFVRIPAPAQPTRPPGPGIPETALWAFVMLATQFVGPLLVILVIFVAESITVGTAGAIAILRDPNSLAGEFSVALVAGTQLVFVLAAIAAAALRLGPRPMSRLGVARIPLVHLLLIPCFLLSALMVSSQLYTWNMQGWQAVVEWAPQLKFFDDFLSMKVVEKLSETASLPAMLAMIALAPAIGEELFFRGIIGRGLVARWGLPAGVMFTSVLFAAFHVHPAHALALIPMAIVFHVSYLATRSILAPMLLHALNNSLAVVTAKFPPDAKVPGLDEVTGLSPETFVAAVVCLLSFIVLVWQIRLRYFLPDGSAWSPGYVTVESPPPEVAAVARCGKADRRVIALAAVSFLIFAALLVKDSLS